MLTHAIILLDYFFSLSCPTAQKEVRKCKKYDPFFLNSTLSTLLAEGDCPEKMWKTSSPSRVRFS